MTPDEFSIQTVLAYHGAQLQGGPRVLQYCKCPSLEFIALEVVDGCVKREAQRVSAYIRGKLDIKIASVESKGHIRLMIYLLK